MKVENEDEQGIRKHKSRPGSLHHGSIVWQNNFSPAQIETLLYHSSFHYGVSTYLNGMTSLLYLYLPLVQRLIAVFILLNDGKVSTCLRLRRKGQHVRCKSGSVVNGVTNGWIWRNKKVSKDMKNQRKQTNTCVSNTTIEIKIIIIIICS